jgi:hypothetical protein
MAATLVIVAGCSGAKPASPAPAAMSMASYQKLLTGIDARLANDTKRLGVTLSPAAVGFAVEITQSDVSGAVQQLQDTTPPPRLKAAHAGLVSAFTALGQALTSAMAGAHNDQLCAGTSALALISRSGGATRLRSAQAQLAAADVQLASFLPPATADTSRRLANGKFVKRPAPTGQGELTVDNGTSTDAVVDLVRGAVTALAVYVRSGSSYTAKGVADGNYQVYFTSGTDWDGTNHVFTRDCVFQKFDNTVSFTTTTSGDTIQYTDDQITLNPVVNGNAKVSDVSPGQYPLS